MDATFYSFVNDALKFRGLDPTSVSFSVVIGAECNYVPQDVLTTVLAHVNAMPLNDAGIAASRDLAIPGR